MKIGVAIPSYIGHIDMLFDLLDSIEKQTRLPDKVVVSCSSTREFINNKTYSFPLQIIVTEEHKNAAQNRNIAISNLMDMDFVTFIDADDIMHPQRIEVLLKVFEAYNVDIILHTFISNNEFEKLEKINVRVNSLVQCITGCIRHSHWDFRNLEIIHHGQVTVKRHILDKVKFPEEDAFLTKEDCTFCHRVFGLENIQNAFIPHGLSLYKPSATGGFRL
jgi:glycosyltransferase involved in cell wall biosynthesis